MHQFSSQKFLQGFLGAQLKGSTLPWLSGEISAEKADRMFDRLVKIDCMSFFHTASDYQSFLCEITLEVLSETAWTTLNVQTSRSKTIQKIFKIGRFYLFSSDFWWFSPLF